MGFADVQEIDPSIKVELKYACTNNFMCANVYGDFKRGYLRREAAEKLAKANRSLKQIHPDLTLLVVDALRPRHVQRKMRSILEKTPMKHYVADPRGGSMHNYGCAVDITIVDAQGNRLDMGTPMDHFGILSQPRHEARFLREGKLTSQQIANRRLLRTVMTTAGFRPIPIEWWHFEAFEKTFIRKAYTIVE
jgi:D-alanyl-D-alanine dipeptidase